MPIQRELCRDRAVFVKKKKLFFSASASSLWRILSVDTLSIVLAAAVDVLVVVVVVIQTIIQVIHALRRRVSTTFVN